MSNGADDVMGDQREIEGVSNGADDVMGHQREAEGVSNGADKVSYDLKLATG